MTAKWMALGIVGLLTIPVHAEEAPILMTSTDKVSYGMGVDMARNFMRQGIKVNLDMLVKGFNDATAGEKLLLSEKELRQTQTSLLAEVRKKQVYLQRTAADVNRQRGVTFFAENKTQDGVVTLPSGLQYQIMKAGNGKKPADADTVQCNYRGCLLDGTEFDSSSPGQPANIRVSEVIPGWREALKLMPVGSTWKIFIPPELAYGPRGVGTDIGPNETIMFEVELVGVKEQNAATP